MRRSLHDLGVAIQRGELAPASSILVAFFKANPQFTSTASDDAQSQDPLTQDFQVLATAISNNEVGAAQTAWTQVKNDLTTDGVANLGDGTTSMSEVLDQTKVSPDSQIAGDTVTYQRSGTNAVAATISSSGNLLNTAV